MLKFWYASFYEKPDVAKNSISVVLETIFDATNKDNELKDLFDGSSKSPIYSQLYTAYKILDHVTKKRKTNEQGYDFIDHTDEIITYGIYKEIMKNKNLFSQSNISNAYDKVVEHIKGIIENEKHAREAKGLEYSHNIYFKSSKSRIDYNEKCNFVDDYELTKNLLTLHVNGAGK